MFKKDSVKNRHSRKTETSGAQVCCLLGGAKKHHQGFPLGEIVEVYFLKTRSFSELDPCLKRTIRLQENRKHQTNSNQRIVTELPLFGPQIVQSKPSWLEVLLSEEKDEQKGS